MPLPFVLLAALFSPSEPSPSALVGALPDHRWITPTQQILSPVGRQVDLPGVRPQDLALSPDGRLLVVGGTVQALLLVDPASGRQIGQVDLPPDPGADPNAGHDDTDLESTKWDKLSLNGLVFSPAGDRIYFSNVNGSIKVFAVSGQHVRPEGVFSLPPATAPKRRQEIPAGLAVSADGNRLYVVADLSNRLLELDARTGRLLRSWDVGVAPFAVVLAHGKAYVSNQGGRRPAPGSRVGPAGQGTEVRVDSRSIAEEGSVSVIDLDAGRVLTELVVGAHASALAASPSGRHVVVAATGADLLQVIDTRSDTLVEKISTLQDPGGLSGSEPCALVFAPDGRQLYVANATENAVGVVRFDPGDNSSQIVGLIPVAWFPASLAYDRGRDQLCVGNLKGLGAARQFLPGEKVKLRTRDYWGTLSLVPAPAESVLAGWTRIALFDLHYPRLLASALPPRAGQPAQPVPERSGEPSVFHHVIYVIKENRTYDQMLGDMPEGRGDPTLCTFGETYTPNQHALARQFVLLDNTYCSGVQSADGHQWTDSAFVNDYLERQLTAGYPRSYPSAKNAPGADALNYASSGFLWDDALRHGHSFRNYGEWLISRSGWTDPQRRGKPAWLDYWQDYRDGGHRTKLASWPAIESLRAHSELGTVGWDLGIPDVLRARKFIADLKAAEGSGTWPDFSVLYLPNDHTGGTKPGLPKPGAEVADNDLALGQVVAALSHSRFWADTCLFAIEDDPQSGWDHLSAYRTTCYVASAYTRRRTVVSVQYNQLSLIRTMELMLGLPPMNQLDATAVPMAECFQPAPDLTPFDAVPNRVPLDAITPPPRDLADAAERARAVASSRLPLALPDQCDDNQLNRILWGAMMGRAPYPDWAIKNVDDD